MNQERNKPFFKKCNKILFSSGLKVEPKRQNFSPRSLFLPLRCRIYIHTQFCVCLVILFIHRGRWCTRLRTHLTAASATRLCLPSIHPPLPHLPKAHQPAPASSTVVVGLPLTPGRHTTPTPCRTRTPNPTTLLPTSNHSSTSPLTTSRPSAPPPVLSWSAGM